MTTDQLDSLPDGTPIYVPEFGDVRAFFFHGRTGDTPYFILLNIPEYGNVERSKRPQPTHALDLIHSTTDEKQAWQTVYDALLKRIRHIRKTHINQPIKS